MSSTRLPGKILMLINGQPILAHVAERCARAVGRNHVVITTSKEPDDTPVAEFAKSHGFSCYRGPLNNVYSRFVAAISFYQIDHFVRVCADSPFLDPDLVENAVAQFHQNNVDLVTNIFPRSYPRGQSVEVIRTSAFLDPAFRSLAGFSEEHITQAFYHHADQFNLLNFDCPHHQDQGLKKWAVDTLEDYNNIKDWAAIHPKGPIPFGVGNVTLHKAKSANA